MGTQLTIYPGMVHDFARLGNITPDATNQVRADIAKALRQHLSPPTSPVDVLLSPHGTVRTCECATTSR